MASASTLIADAAPQADRDFLIRYQGGGASVDAGSWVSYDVASLLRSGATSFRFSPLSSNDFIANSRQATSNPPQLVLWLTGQ